MTVARRRAPRTPEQRQAQAIRAMAPGSLNGTVANASPVKLTAANIRMAAVTKSTSSGGASVTVSPTAPSSPATGDLWYDTDETC